MSTHKKSALQDLNTAFADTHYLVLPQSYNLPHGSHQPQKSFTTNRTALHRGRKIKIRTSYRIEIDGEPMTMHTKVMDDGSVHCHGLPNYSFASAVDMARALIDATFLVGTSPDELGQHAAAGPAHGHGEAGR